MNRLLIYFFCTISCNLISAQSTFNYRLSFDRPVPTVLTNIEVTDSCFYAAGLTNDSLPPYYLGGLFSKISFEGEIEWYKTFHIPDENIWQWQSTLRKLPDGNFGISALHTDSNQVSAMLIKYDAFGNALSTFKNPSPNLPENNFIYHSGSFFTENGGYVSIFNVTNPDLSKTEIYVVMKDSLDETIWENYITHPSYNKGSIFADYTNGKILIGGAFRNTNLVPQFFDARTSVIQLDSTGNIDWEYQSPEGELQGLAHAVIPTSDGGYLYSGGRGIELTNPNGMSGTLRFNANIFKLDANQNLEWEVGLRDSIITNSNIKYKLIELSDGSGYMVAGGNYEINLAESGYDLNGTLSKISPAGDSLWTRYYRFVESRADNHVFYDMEATSDGGFVMVGEATTLVSSDEPPRQRAWIVKVDEHGCLVPGCELVSVSSPNRSAFEIKLYPNPATDYLNVYFYHPELNETAIFTLTNNSGKSVLSFKSKLGDITHMIPVDHLLSGQYWLSCRVGDIIEGKAVVIQN